MHPSEGIWESKSTLLRGKRIALGITGSIAAVQSFELARELIRHGAEVVPVMSDAATKLVTPWTMQFATDHEAITQIDGRAQHVAMFGDFPDAFHLLLIHPCTANTISKMAMGVDDTPVTTMATMAIGTKTPVLVAPAMHLAMYTHPLVQRNLKTLEEIGVKFVGPWVEGDKAKIASVEEIVAAVIRLLGPSDFQGRSILIIGGSSQEPIDEMRVITNRGTGETAISLATAAFQRGADVELWIGQSQFPIPSYIKSKGFSRTQDLLNMLDQIKRDIVLVPAALSDFAPSPQKGKLDSQKGLTLKLEPVPKILPYLRPYSTFLVGFKAEKGLSQEELVKRAKKRLKQHDLDLIVANDLSNVAPGRSEVQMIHRDGTMLAAAGSKREVANAVLDEVLKGSR